MTSMVTLLGTVATWLGGAAVAAAQAPPIQTLAEAPRHARAPDVALTRDGSAAVAWQSTSQCGRSCTIQELPSRIVAATRKAGEGVFDPGQRVSAPKERGFLPVVGRADDGTVIVAWRRHADKPWRRGAISRAALRVAIRPAGAERFLPAKTIVRAASGRPVLAVNGRGDAVLAWERRSGYVTGHVEAAHLAAGRRTFGPPQLLGKETDGRPQAGINASGRAVVAWAEIGGTGQAMVRAPGRSSRFARRKLFTEDAATHWTDAIRGVDIDDEGTVSVLWNEWYEVHAATWSTARQSAVARHELDDDLGSPDTNGAMARAGGGWASTWSSNGSVEVAIWGDGADPPQRTRVLDESCWDADPAVAGDRDGRVLVAWGGRCGDEGGIGFVYRAANGTTFSQESRIGTGEHPRSAPHLAMDGDGRATIVWQAMAPDGRQIVRAATVALP